MNVIRSAVVAALVVVSGARVEAQLPSAAKIYDKYATAVGGRDAWAKAVGRTETGTADITFAGLSGTYERHSAEPNKMRMIIDLGMAKVDQGFDGTFGWAVQPMGAATRMDPAQEKNLAAETMTGAGFLDPSRFAKVSVDAKETFEGVECYKVTVTRKSGETAVEYFEVESGLRRGTVASTPMGEQKTSFFDYKDFEGKKIASKIVQATPQGDVVLTIAAVKFGAPDPALFKLPDGIK